MIEDKDLFSDAALMGANAPDEISVSALSALLKQHIEGRFSYVRVKGELSKVTIAKSGHLYTALKDDTAVLDAVCWKATVSRLNVKPEEGMEVVCTGRLTTYPGRSNYQLVIEEVELAGRGALLKMLEDRKKKLLAEGLFEPARKKKIPYLPRIIGIITSPTGAVIRDMIHRLSDRFPCHVLLYPVQVQGAKAAAEVGQAIAFFNGIKDPALRPDLLIVARGGGSFEDLMPFNDEALVRVAAASVIPLISAVGHETDTTLIDFAADLRAPTPTAAAEMAVPMRSELKIKMTAYEQQLMSMIYKLMRMYKAEHAASANRLLHPRAIFENAAMRFDHAALRLEQALFKLREIKKQQFSLLVKSLSLEPIKQKSVLYHERLLTFQQRLQTRSESVISAQKEHLLFKEKLLNALSYKKILARGFALVQSEDGALITTAAEAKAEDRLKLTFQDDILVVKTDQAQK
jgi:exodeoxyribonuclease VII large subunit